MAGRKHRVIRRREVAVEPEIEADDEVEDDDEVEEDEELEDEEDEEEEIKQPVRKAKVPAPKPAPVKAAPAPAPKKAPAPLPEDDEEEEKTPAAPVKIKNANAMVVDGLLAGAMTALADGKSLVITALGDNKYSIVMGETQKSARKLRGAEYAQEVLSPEYIKWMSEWKLKTYDEKVAFAKKIKVTWEAHATPQINVMRVTDAVRTKLGLEKYKEQYRSRSARAALLG